VSVEEVARRTERCRQTVAELRTVLEALDVEDAETELAGFSASTLEWPRRRAAH
jgi:hypothetical protein